MKFFRMRSTIFSTLFGTMFLLSSCASNGDRLVPLAEEALPKTVMLNVFSVVDALKITVENDKLKMEVVKALVQFRGSGVYVSPTGHILTCDHMVSYGDVKDVLITQYDGTMMKAEILYKESRVDLALLKVNIKSPYARLTNPRGLKVGQEVFAVGNPLGMDFSVSHGIISALYRDQVGVPNMTQSDTFINPGNSGGPLFNMKGELVGINSRVLPPVDAPIFTGLGFSVDPTQILQFLTRFRGIDTAFRTPRGIWKGLWDAITLGY